MNRDIELKKEIMKQDDIYPIISLRELAEAHLDERQRMKKEILEFMHSFECDDNITYVRTKWIELCLEEEGEK